MSQAKAIVIRSLNVRMRSRYRLLLAAAELESTVLLFLGWTHAGLVVGPDGEDGPDGGVAPSLSSRARIPAW